MAQAGEIRFDAIIDTSDYDSGAKRIQTATSKIEDSAGQADKAIGDIGKNAGGDAPKIKDAFIKTFDGIGELADGLGVSLPGKLVKVASIGGALAAVGGVFKTGFDTAMSQIDVQGTLDAQLGRGTEGAKNAGIVAGRLYREGWGESLADVADVASNVAQVIRGIGENDLRTVTRATEVWAGTFDADAGESIRGVNVLMQKFGLSATDATDLMTKGMQNGLNYTDELGDNLAEYSGRWAEAGTSAQEYFSLLQAGVDSGAYSLDKVGDFLNEFMTSLTDGRMEKGMSDFSQSTQDVFTEFQNGRAKAEDVLNAVIGELGHMTDKTKEASIASTLWSSLGEDNAMGMIEALANVPNKYQDIKGATDAAADSTMSISQQWEAFKRTLAGMLGDTFTPFVKEFISGLTSMSQQFVAFVGSVDWSFLGNSLNALGTVFGTAFAAAVPTLRTVVDALSAMSQWFVANSDAVTTALVAIGVGFGVFRAASIITTVVTALQGFSLAANMASIAQWAFNAAMNANPIVLVISLVAALVAGLVYFFTQTELGKQMWSDFTVTLASLWSALSSRLISLWGNITSALAAAGGQIKAIWSSVTAFVATVPGRMSGFFAGIGERIGGFFSGVGNAIGSRFDSAVAYVRGIPGKIRAAFGNAGSLLTGVGSDLVAGLINGISSRIGGVIEECRSLASSAVDTVKSFLKIGSPSRVFRDEVGQWIPAGIAVGVDKGLPELQETLAAGLDAIIRPIPQKLSDDMPVPLSKIDGKIGSSVMPLEANTTTTTTVNAPITVQTNDPEAAGRAAARQISFYLL